MIKYSNSATHRLQVFVLSSCFMFFSSSLSQHVLWGAGRLLNPCLLYETKASVSYCNNAPALRGILTSRDLAFIIRALTVEDLSSAGGPKETGEKGKARCWCFSLDVERNSRNDRVENEEKDPQMKQEMS